MFTSIFIQITDQKLLTKAKDNVANNIIARKEVENNNLGLI